MFVTFLWHFTSESLWTASNCEPTVDTVACLWPHTHLLHNLSWVSGGVQLPLWVQASLVVTDVHGVWAVRISTCVTATTMSGKTCSSILQTQKLVDQLRLEASMERIKVCYMSGEKFCFQCQGKNSFQWFLHQHRHDYYYFLNLLEQLSAPLLH